MSAPAASLDADKKVIQCARCASHVEWSDGTPTGFALRFRALREAEIYLLRGAIVGLCSHGRNHLIADARREDAVRRIRELAGIERDALPLMFQTVDAAKVFFDIPVKSRKSLSDPDSGPVSLARKKTWRELPLAPAVNPASAGKVPVMVSKTSLHFLLLGRIESPVVAVEVDSFDEPGGKGPAARSVVPVLVLDCPAYRWLKERRGTKVVCFRGRVGDGEAEK
jgi:hydrogenase maturation factor HypF (carbamoyltransferase family)